MSKRTLLLTSALQRFREGKNEDLLSKRSCLFSTPGRVWQLNLRTEVGKQIYSNNLQVLKEAESLCLFLNLILKIYK